MEVGSHGKWHRRALLLAAMQWHHKVVLDAGAKAIAKIKGYDFAGHYESGCDYSDPLFFVPGDTLLVDEASCLGIRSPNDLYGGVVPHLFAKTKAITHGLVDCQAERPLGWSIVFAERVRGVVLPGYTVFSSRDARVAARRMLRRGPLRLKKPLSASGRDQTLRVSCRGRYYLSFPALRDSDASTLRTSDWEIPNCLAMREGVIPALKAARTALTWPRVNATLASSGCRRSGDASVVVA